jgi:hypothetical protein
MIPAQGAATAAPSGFRISGSRPKDGCARGLLARADARPNDVDVPCTPPEQQEGGRLNCE